MGSTPQSSEPGSKALQDLPKDVLEHLAEDVGVDPTRFKTRQDLAAAIEQRKTLIAAMDRDAMLEVLRWGRRAVPANATKHQLAVEITRIKLMRFAGLSQRGLLVLAVLRGVDVKGDEDDARLIRRLKRQEGFFSRLSRKRRGFIGSIVSNMLGEDDERAGEYHLLPPQPAPQSGAPAPPPAPSPHREASLREEIEDAGLFGGLASRVKRSADSYLNQKMDEIELRIDRKLDEIDNRLAEWRDKEIANRIRILKITLWASVIVAVLSLMYTYVRVHFWPS